MKRHGRILTGFILFLVLLPLSCRRGEESLSAEKPAEAPVERPRDLLAKSTVDRLRVRALPYLDAEVVSFLSSGDEVLVESVTEWTQTLDTESAPWYFVRGESFSGWTYGGFLRFTSGSAEDVPVNPALPKPADEPEKAPAGTIDPADLPEILVPIFGMEGDPPQIPGPEGTIGYDAFHEVLVLPFGQGADSRLAPVSSGTQSLNLVAKSDAGDHFERRFNASEVRTLAGNWKVFIGSESRDALIVPFHRLATLNPGSWEIYAFPGDDTWPAAGGKISIVPASVSILPVENPDPFVHDPNSTYRVGQSAYCFGYVENGRESRQVALYHDTREDRSGMILLRPVRGQRVEVDSSGRWKWKVPIESDFPDGRYWIAVGNPIMNVEDVRFFITSLTVEP